MTLALPRRPQGIESQILFKNFLKAPLTWKVILFLIARCLHANLLSAFPLNTVKQANRNELLFLPFCQTLKTGTQALCLHWALFCPLQRRSSSIPSTAMLSITAILHEDRASSHFSLLIVLNLSAAFDLLLPDLSTSTFFGVQPLVSRSALSHPPLCGPQLLLGLRNGRLCPAGGCLLGQLWRVGGRAAGFTGRVHTH